MARKMKTPAIIAFRCKSDDTFLHTCNSFALIFVFYQIFRGQINYVDNTTKIFYQKMTKYPKKRKATNSKYLIDRTRHTVYAHTVYICKRNEIFLVYQWT